MYSVEVRVESTVDNKLTLLVGWWTCECFGDLAHAVAGGEQGVCGGKQLLVGCGGQRLLIIPSHST